MIEFVGAGEGGALSCDDGIGIASTGRFSAAFPDRGEGLVAVTIDVDAIFTRPLDCEGEIWSINFEQVSVIEMAYSQFDRAQREAQLQIVVIEIEKGDAGF